VDRAERPELCSGIIDIIAPDEYVLRPPPPPSYVFVIDVSVEAVQSGLLQVVASAIKRVLGRLPGAPRTQVCCNAKWIVLCGSRVLTCCLNEKRWDSLRTIETCIFTTSLEAPLARFVLFIRKNTN